MAAVNPPTDNGPQFELDSVRGASSTAYVASVAPDSTKAHLWKTSNFGGSWTKLDVASGLPAGVPVNQVTKLEGTLYAATHLGVYVSSDDGASFVRWGSGLPLVNVWDLNFSNTGAHSRRDLRPRLLGNHSVTAVLVAGLTHLSGPRNPSKS